MNEVTELSTLALAVLTAIYVVFTYKMLSQTKRANDLTQSALQRQFDLATYPRLTCWAKLSAGSIKIIIQNPATIPATDVDVLTIALYEEVDIDVSDFVARYIRKGSDDRSRLFRTHQGFFGVYDHIFYYSLPQQTQVAASLNAPLPCNNLLVLLQFRDVSRRNYYTLYCFAADGVGSGDQRFRAIGIWPKGISESPRVVYTSELVLKTEDDSPIPKDVEQEFRGFWDSSISCGFLIVAEHDVEDRGESSSI